MVRAPAALADAFPADYSSVYPQNLHRPLKPYPNACHTTVVSLVI